TARLGKEEDGVVVDIRRDGAISEGAGPLHPKHSTTTVQATAGYFSWLPPTNTHLVSNRQTNKFNIAPTTTPPATSAASATPAAPAFNLLSHIVRALFRCFRWLLFRGPSWLLVLLTICAFMVVPLINLYRPALSDAQRIEAFKQTLLHAEQTSNSRDVDWTPPDFLIHGAGLLADFSTSIINSDHPDQAQLLDLTDEAHAQYNRLVASAHKLYHTSADFEAISSIRRPQIEQAEAKLQRPPRDAPGNIWTAIKPYGIPHFLQSNGPSPHQQIVGFSQRTTEQYSAVQKSIDEYCDAIRSFTGGLHSIDAALDEDITGYPTLRGKIVEQLSSRFLRWNQEQAAQINSHIRQVRLADEKFCPLPVFIEPTRQKGDHYQEEVDTGKGRLDAWIQKCKDKGECRGLEVELEAMGAVVKSIMHDYSGRTA
ncbi:MAG: hypothetical protein Q9197_006794, partial [Variospora fuerteventurae]